MSRNGFERGRKLWLLALAVLLALTGTGLAGDDDAELRRIVEEQGRQIEELKRQIQEQKANPPAPH